MLLLKMKKWLFSLSVVALIGISISANAMEDLKLQKDTEHFLFYCTEQDVSCLNDFSQKLEKNYQRICNDLGYDFNEKIKVKIFPDIRSLHSAIGHPDAPDWCVGYANHGEISMTSPLNPGPAHNYHSLSKTIVHEFTHIVVHHINSEIPKWLDEGLASFEAGQMDENRRDFLIKIIRANQIPKIKDLEVNSVSFGDKGGYQWSYTIVEFAVQDYGWDKVREWIRNKGVIKSTFKMSDAEFQKKWTDFLEKNYYLR